jgi:ribosomal-protein-alanine N-acetyltransferase
MDAPRHPYPLRTARLELRPAAPIDAAAMAAFMRANEAHLGPWSPTPPADFYTEEHWAHRFETEAHDAIAGRGVRFLFATPDDPDGIVGWATLSTIVRGVWHCCNLGYGLGAAHEGRGLMVEGLEAVIARAFGPMNLHRIQANYMPSNARSAKVLRRLGFKVEGYAYDFLRINGAWEDHVLTALTNPDWREHVH